MARLPQQMTTAQLKSMISGGAKKSDLPTKANGRSVTSTRDSATKAYQDQLDRIERTRVFVEKSKSLTKQDAFDIVNRSKPRISNTTNTYFVGENRDMQINDYFRSNNQILGDYFRSERNPDVFTVGLKQTKLREESKKITAQIKQKKAVEIQVINYTGLGEDKVSPIEVISTSVIKTKSKDKIPQNKNNQEVLLDSIKSNDKKEIISDIGKQAFLTSGVMIASMLVGGIVIYFKVLKK